MKQILIAMILVLSFSGCQDKKEEQTQHDAKIAQEARAELLKEQAEAKKKQEELESREEGKFIDLSEKEKERALRSYEETHYGSNWLSRIMTLTMEGMFSDPIYGSNVKEAGWKALGSYGGLPRPTTRYIKL